MKNANVFVDVDLTLVDANGRAGSSRRQMRRRSLPLLDGQKFPLIANNGERVCLAILQLSAGEMDRFYRELQQAKMDWRDTLVAAGL